MLALLGLARSRPAAASATSWSSRSPPRNTIPVGLALGRWQGRLLPYVPQLPLEWAALATALTAWLHAPAGVSNPRQLAVLAGVTVVAARRGGSGGDLVHPAPARCTRPAGDRGEATTPSVIWPPVACPVG